MSQDPRIETVEKIMPKSGHVSKIVVFLHGLGADGKDLIDIGAHWRDSLDNTLFLSPDAPFPCDMAPYGRQWFSLQNRSIETINEGVRSSAPALNVFLDSCLKEHGLDAADMAVVGFSQGTMMALYSLPRRLKACAGILGYSGLLPNEAVFEKECISRPPVVLVHGRNDQVVPYLGTEKAFSVLKANSFEVKKHILPGLEHGINPEGLEIGKDFLRTRLGIQQL